MIILWSYRAHCTTTADGSECHWYYNEFVMDTTQMTNGIITHYQVQYRRSDSSNSSTFTSVSTTNIILTYTVTELTSDTEYEFRVRAFTVVGHGPSSNGVTHYTS